MIIRVDIKWSLTVAWYYFKLDCYYLQLNLKVETQDKIQNIIIHGTCTSKRKKYSYNLEIDGNRITTHKYNIKYTHTQSCTSGSTCTFQILLTGFVKNIINITGRFIFEVKSTWVPKLVL